MEVSSQLYPQGKSPWYPLDRTLGEPQSRSWRGGEEKNSQPRRESNPDRPVRSPALYRLSYTNLKSQNIAFLFISSLLRLIDPDI
jgi:hypothetical protein